MATEESAATSSELNASQGSKKPQGASSRYFKVGLMALVFVVAFTVKLFSPDLLSGSKKHKSYRFRGNPLGFFVGDLSLFHTATSEEAEDRIVAVFPDELQPKVKSVIRPVLTLCEKHGVDPFWVLSVMWTESHFRFQATSKKGARGLMQVMPETNNELLTKLKVKGIALEADRGEAYLAQRYSTEYRTLGYHLLVQKLRNLEVGIFYLKSLLQDFDYNHFHATVAYNMGPNWAKEKLRSQQSITGQNHYLKKVMTAYIHITKNLSHNANVSFVKNRF